MKKTEKDNKKGKKGCPGIVFIIVYFAVASFIFFKFFYRDLLNFTRKGAPISDIVDMYAYDEDEIKECLSSRPSDIAGMSRLDKYEAGLDPADGSDTDLDGLADKEEIEVYHSDPLKYSTSGDLYSDYYKVSNNMDINTEYSGADGLSFENNFCPEVTLTAMTASDYAASVFDCTGSPIAMLKNKKAIKEYFVAFYSGDIAIDLSKLSDIDKSNVSVYTCSFYDSRAKYCDKASVNGDTLTISPGYPAREPYIVYLVNDSSPFKKIIGRFTASVPVVDGNAIIASAPDDEALKNLTSDSEAILAVMEYKRLFEDAPTLYVNSDYNTEIAKEYIFNKMSDVLWTKKDK